MSIEPLRNGKSFVTFPLLDERLKSYQALTPRAHQRGVEMFQKGNVQSVFALPSAPRPVSQVTEMYDTEFEEDFSDFEEYSGRRSEESVGTQDNFSHCPSNIFVVWQQEQHNRVDFGRGTDASVK